MLVTSSSNGVYPVRSTQPCAPTGGGTDCSAVSAAQSSYDHLELSPEPSGEQRFQLDLNSRLSQEVRSATTTGEIRALTQQIASGEYRPNAMETAAKMLLMKGDTAL
ncbi:MAG: flagellar biosynthesis anti-sigma factor FlgM [Pygmaiobacter massiliensis]|nr:flagellar biosynthesis anti-sigma factor FlgM [Pygmaiobacter massiliensis]